MFPAPFLCGVGVLLLKPFGLHHILLAMVRFTGEGTEFVDGYEVAGRFRIFLCRTESRSAVQPACAAFCHAGLYADLYLWSACGRYYLPHRKTGEPSGDQRLLLVRVLVSVVTGISEPIEFLFLFIAPVLYIFHIIMSGLALLVMALLGVTIGNTDGGILDLLIFGIMRGTATKWHLVFPVGIIWFAIRFFVFRW